jgi:hypothetical protein
MIRNSLFLSACLLTGLASIASTAADAPTPRAVSSMSELMLKIIQPNSDAVFYISRNEPQNETEWLALEARILMLAESANLLMLPGYARDQQQWMAESVLFRDAAESAYLAAKARNLAAFDDLNNELYGSCESCHDTYR